MIYIITPWSGSTAVLVDDYVNATINQDVAHDNDICVIAVNNASDDDTRAELKRFTDHSGGFIIDNDDNKGFAFANNQGYELAISMSVRDSDVIIFLNSDVYASGEWLKHVEKDVKHGSLYGPSLQQQFIAGRYIPYIEGWCIAATKQTWDKLIGTPNEGPWDAVSYPDPYWEDNDLCFCALVEGISLVQTTWPIHHKGGQTAGNIAQYAEAFEKNRQTFTSLVIENLNKPQITPMHAHYVAHCNNLSDIQHHLPLLYSLAQGNIIELGTRSGVSTVAFLAGCERRGGRVWSVDIDDCSHLYTGHPLWQFIQSDSRDVPHIKRQIIGDDINEPFINTLLVDTLHTYNHVAQELEAWADYVVPGGYILIHDPETFPGVRRAVQEFCDKKQWDVTFVLPCNGMAVIEVPQ